MTGLGRARLGFLVALATATGCDPRTILSDDFNGIRLRTPRTKPALTSFTDLEGKSFDVTRETAGRVTLLYFGYSHCPEVCPVQLMHLGAGLRQLGGDSASQVRVLVVSIDPARDTGAVFATWVRSFHPGFIGLRAPRREVDAEVRRLGFAPPSDNSTDTTSVDPAHASAVIAFARDGLGRFIYPKDTSPNAWAYDIRKLLRGDEALER